MEQVKKLSNIDERNISNDKMTGLGEICKSPENPDFS